MPVTSDDDSMGAVELLLSITPAATIAPTVTKTARIDAVTMSFFLLFADENSPLNSFMETGGEEDDDDDDDPFAVCIGGGANRSSFVGSNH